MESEKTFLFFDVECANCFGGVGKMCSFGYVLTDSSFNILENDDIVMNPESEFDWFLLKNGGTSLAYPKSFFLSQKPFPFFSERIFDLICEKNRQIFAFGALSDVGFVVTAFERYRLSIPQFCAFDLERFCKIDGEISGSLEKRCSLLKIDNSDLTAHKSSDDALMTMRLFREFLKKSNLLAETALSSRKELFFSSSDFLKKRESKMQKKARQKRRNESRRRDSKTIHFD